MVINPRKKFLQSMSVLLLLAWTGCQDHDPNGDIRGERVEGYNYEPDNGEQDQLVHQSDNDGFRVDEYTLEVIGDEG